MQQKPLKSVLEPPKHGHLRRRHLHEKIDARPPAVGQAIGALKIPETLHRGILHRRYAREQVFVHLFAHHLPVAQVVWVQAKQSIQLQPHLGPVRARIRASVVLVVAPQNLGLAI